MRSGTLAERTRRLADQLGRLERHTWAAVQHISQNIVPGEFRSPYRFPYGLERDVPRTFTLDDDFATLHTATVPPSLVVRSLAEAILRGDMRATQAVHHGDAVFAVIVDVSRSMLSGCFAGDGPLSLAQEATSKIHALFMVVATYLKLAESTGFNLRAVHVGGARAEEQRAVSPRNFVQQVMFSMGQRLLASYVASEEDPARVEPFTMRQALALVSTYRHRGIVILASDFLDPLEGYHAALAQVAARNRVVLVDLAAPEDRALPVPGWLDVEATRVPLREGARHLETGTAPRLVDAAGIVSWNRARQADLRRLRSLAARYSADLVPGGGVTYKEVTTRAMELLSRAPRP